MKLSAATKPPHGNIRRPRSGAGRRGAAWLSALVLLAGAAPARAADPFMWDQDGNGLDDRLEQTVLSGITAAYENNDPTGGRLRFEVSQAGPALSYGAYVRFTHAPTPADSASLVQLGAQVVTLFESVPYIRVRGTWPTLTLIAARPDVDRVEAVCVMYLGNWRTARATGVRSGGGPPFPTLEDEGGPTGAGVVVALLDTGINDAPIGGWPGHRDLAGKVLGGAAFPGPGPTGYTPRDESVNPAQTAPGSGIYHATHLAGTIGGGVGRTRALGGLAPDVRFVDVKVLDDNGSGYGVAEGLEWCLANRLRDWGGGRTGIQIINLSLSGTDASDGRDCLSALVDSAAARGILVVASAGNDGRCGFIPSPGAAAGAITVGADDAGDPSDVSDDTLAAFSNEGPRTDDGDGNPWDELKPDLVAPGVDISSADGSVLTSGAAYVTASGTSQAAAAVAGALAVLKSADPGLTPAAARALLARTAWHRQTPTHACSAGHDPLGIDTRYHAGWGYGVLDVHAAWLELTRPAATQVVRLSAAWNPPAGVRVAWTTQREIGLTGFEVQRAPDAGGAPGPYSAVAGGFVPAAGVAGLDAQNRTAYEFVDSPPAGQRFWYRLRLIGPDPPESTLPVDAWSETPAAVAEWTVQHNLPETDLSMSLGSESPGNPLWSNRSDFFHDLVSARPAMIGDLLRCTLRQPLHHLPAGAWPPGPASPWWLQAVDGGDPTRQGTLNDFRVSDGTSLYVTDTLRPRSTVEGGTAILWIPDTGLTGVPDRQSSPASRLWLAPNPTRGAVRIQFSMPHAGTVQLTVLDVQGRAVYRGPVTSLGAGLQTLGWDGRGNLAGAVSSGHYFLRLAFDDRVEVRSLVIAR